MKTSIQVITMLAVGLVALHARAVTTIDPGNKYAYGANIGWINAEGDVNNGAVIGQAFCSGYLYGANVGWIHLGDGTPANGMAYQNNSATDYGVNHNGLGSLSGYAYGANVGWISFEQTYGQPKVDLGSGSLSGYAWGANVGWINLSTLATLTLSAPDTDNDHIADAWEYSHTNTLSVLTDGGADSDGDGVSDVDEYGGDTDPFDAGDYLVITSYTRTTDDYNNLWWTSKPTRLYRLDHRTDLTTNTWVQMVTGFETSPGWNNVGFNSYNTNDFYRIRSAIPLSP